MSKLDASTASVAAINATDDKYDDDDDDDDRKLSPLAPGGMMTERDNNNIVPAQRANAAFASHSSVEEDEDTPPAASASSSSTGGASSRRGRGSTISTFASASTTIGGSGGGAGGGNATVLIQRGDTMKDRVAKRLRIAAFGTPATPTGETRRLARTAFSGLVKNDEVYSAIVEYAGDEEESQEIYGMCITNAGMERNVTVDLTASAALTALATSAIAALNASAAALNASAAALSRQSLTTSSSSTNHHYQNTTDAASSSRRNSSDRSCKSPPRVEKQKSPPCGSKLSYINISDGAIAEETIDSPTKKLKSCTKAKSAVGDVIEIESSEDERDDSRKEKADGDVTENKLFLVYPFDVDEELLRKASRGLLELGGDSLGVVPILDDQPAEDVTRVTRIPLRTHYVIIRENDYKRLSPGQLLNDALVDFWMRWISRSESWLPSSDVHFFTSHFMTKLKKNGPDAVLSWTKKKDINIFKKKLIFIPVHSDLHWSLLVVVNPGKIANVYNDDLPETEDHSFILFLDSYKLHNKHVYAKHIRQWLNSEHRRLGRGEVGDRIEPFMHDSIRVVSPKIPLQDNGCDCGVFVCRYAYNLYIMRHHRFTWKGYKDSFMSLITNGPAFQFDMSEIARIRKEMTTLVDNLSKVYLRWLKEQELADRTDDVNPVMLNVPRVPDGEPTTACPSISYDADGDVTDEKEKEGVDVMWELTKIYTLKELKKSKPIMCSNKDCGLVACSQWESTEGMKPWNSCLNCQAADFGGWPSRDEQDLPVDHITKEHRWLIVEKCSNPGENPYPDMPDLPLVPEEEEEEEKEEEHDDDEKGDSKPCAKINPPRNRRVNDRDYMEQNDTDDEDDNDDSMKPRAKKKPRSKKSSSTSTNALTKIPNSRQYTNESKIVIINYVESFNVQHGAQARACRHFGIEKSLVSCIMRDKQNIINAKQRKIGPFTDEEIKQLRDLVNQHGKDWTYIETIMHRSERSLDERWKQLLEADKWTKTDDFPNMPIDLKCLIEKEGHAYHISSTGPGDMTRCTSEIKMRIIERMKTRRTDELNEYLSTFNDKSVSVIIPAKQLQESEYDFSGSKERKHPHLYNTKTKKFKYDPSDYVYVCNDVFKGINKHRFATERTKYYGPRGSHKTWLYIYIVDPDTYKKLNFQSVGLGYIDPYFKKSDCPVKIHSCFKVTYDGNDLSNATFKKVYPK